MARFKADVNDLLKDFQELERRTPEMIDKMLDRAGDVAKEKIERGAKKAFKNPAKVLGGLKKTKTYSTKDGSRNIHVGFFGYVPGSKPTKRHPKGTPIPLIAMAREYGTSRGEQKNPFIRPAFNQQAMKNAMLKVQKEYIPEDDAE